MSAEQAAQAEFDKSLLALSGGGLGITIAFLKDVVGTKPPIGSGWLLAAWICWALSLTSILFSHLTSSKASRKALEATDLRTIYLTMGASPWSIATRILNILAAVAFVGGVISLLRFVFLNPVC